MEKPIINNIQRQIASLQDKLFAFGIHEKELTRDITLLFLFIRRMECLFAPSKSKVLELYHNMKDELDYNDMDKKIRSLISPLNFYTVSDNTMEELLAQGYLDTVSGFEHYIDTFDKETKSQLADFGAFNCLNRLAYVKALPLVTSLFCKMEIGSNFSEEEFMAVLNDVFIASTESIHSGNIQTPKELSDIMSIMLFLSKSPNANVSLYDPTCGSSFMLREMTSTLTEPSTNMTVYGQDIDARTVSMSYLIAKCLGRQNQQFAYGDTLSVDKFPDRKFDYIAADFPLSLHWDESLMLNQDSRYFAYPSKQDATLLFVQHIVSKMNATGRAVFTCALRSLTDEDEGSNTIRKWLLENDLLDTILLLPAGIIPGYAIPICICVLDKNKVESRRGKVQILYANEVFPKRRLGYAVVDDAVKAKLTDAYKGQRNMVENEKFFFYVLDVLQPVRSNDGSVKLSADGKKIVDTEKSLSIRVPASETNIIKYVKESYLNYCDPEAWVDFSSIKSICVIDVKKLRSSSIQMFSLDKLESSANDVRSEIMNLFHDIFMVIDKPGMASESIHLPHSSCMLNAVARIINPRGRDNSTLMEGEYPLLTISYLLGESETDLHYPEDISHNILVNENDTLIVRSGFHAGEVLRGKKGCLSNLLLKIESNSSKLLPDYVYFMLKAKEAIIKDELSGSAVRNLTTKDLASLPVYVPSIEEQQRVIDTLSDKVSSIDKLLPMLGGKAKQTMQEYRQALIMDAVLGGK